MRPISAFLLLSAWFSFTSQAQSQDFDSRLETMLKDSGLPAIAAAGLVDGELKVLGAAGSRAMGTDAKVTHDDLWHLGSCGKAMTATMIARLVEEEEMLWETTIIDVFPEMEESIDKGFRYVTILELLRHRGGIAERLEPERGALLAGPLSALEGSPREIRRQAIPIVLALPPTTKPGTTSDYSNYGYMIAGAMAEEVMDSTWRELMTTYVFKPLGIESAGFCLPGSAKSMDQPHGHREVDGALQSVEPTRDNELPECIAPAGLIHMSMQDWGKFAQAHLDGGRGEGDFLSAETFAILQTPPEGLAYACGWGVLERPWSPDGPVLSHNGSNGAWLSVLWISPSRNVAMMAATNCAAPSANGTLDAAVSDVLVQLGVLPSGS